MYLQEIIYAFVLQISPTQITVQEQIRKLSVRNIYNKQMLSTVCSGNFLRHKEYILGNILFFVHHKINVYFTGIIHITPLIIDRYKLFRHFVIINFYLRYFVHFIITLSLTLFCK